MAKQSKRKMRPDRDKSRSGSAKQRTLERREARRLKNLNR